MYNPISTYRIQFHKGFTFSDFEKIIPYLAQLGVQAIYASPIFEAVPGSMHGYDVTDPLNINPEIGTLSQLKAISKKLKKLGIGWLQDIVPNHMAFHPNNKWLMDVLENGRESQYAGFFDILWDSPIHDGKLMVPFLGKPLDGAIDAAELKLAWNDKPVIDYFGQQYPLNRISLEEIDETGDKSIIDTVNKDKSRLKQLIEAQPYALCDWQETDKQINFRRFFTVNGLICLNMQDEQVFDRYHVLIKNLLDDGVFQGLRVDHIDGLYDPKTYLERLRELAGPDTYIIVEKILEKGEQFPADWPVQGNTGYDLLATLNNLFTNRESKKNLSELYNSIDPGSATISQQILQKKRLILDSNMQGELDNLYHLFTDLKLADEHETKGLSTDTFKKAIAELLVRCPVYRFYGNTMPLPEEAAGALDRLLKEISKNDPLLASVNDVLENSLLLKPETCDADYRERALHFYQRLMQFTGPLMAKGVEDTLMYTYNRFIDHNEVGDAPGSFGLKTEQFHELMIERARRWPLSMNASSTHDTKRGEDVRARLNVLSDLPEDWAEKVKQWRELNEDLKTDQLPDANDEYFIYQTITGTLPIPGQDDDNFKERLGEYLVKALREGKRNTNWATPDDAYEEAAKKFAVSLLSPKNKFWKSFEDFHRRIADFGIVNSLAQTALKYTCPGVPDLYQGCELWDLSMVDPDNRRPVCYPKREAFLSKDEDWARLWDDRFSGRIKQALTKKLLYIRSGNTPAFACGSYIPLKIKGRYKNHILAFARHENDQWLLTVVPLHVAQLVSSVDDLLGFDWDDTRVMLPSSAPLSWANLLTGKSGYNPKSIAVKSIFGELPVALLQLKPSKNERNAGILLHITSLPSAFGIGDIGPQAYQFADFLQSARQKIWQMLPVNPVDGAAGYSPYSATSAMAGNVLLISPELLLKDGLLSHDDIKPYHGKPGRVNFPKVLNFKKPLFDAAYLNFLSADDTDAFENFKKKEAGWLDDFAAFQYLKDKFGGRPWYEWPGQYKNRQKTVLQEIVNEITVDKIKWLQFVFNKQWAALRQYCQSKSIRLLGDMPFYISYDSADVWANPGLFKLDKKGNIKGIAGVPPDYFSETGQLWGMPVYNWQTMKDNGYDWWIKRIERNLQFFDQIRLDHFRAFSSYWEVPGGSKNAIGGSWQPGPGADFFEKLKERLGHLPFVAEDLGDIDESVYQLRDQFCLPGMRVLQFAFDKAMPVSEHVPHNYSQNSVAYTGTHDNNTIRGWYQNDINGKVKRRIRKYMGCKVDHDNVHKILTGLCYASVSNIAIIPMQDILGLDGNARMNIPSSADGNWTWQLNDDRTRKGLIKYLEKIAIKYNR